MKTKIFKIQDCDTTDEVLLYTKNDEDGNPIVIIHAWHDNDCLDHLQEETITFPNDSMASNFVRDYSESSANDFVNSVIF